MKQTEFDTMMENWLKNRKNAAGHAEEAMNWAIGAGVTEGAEPQMFVTREETAVMLHRALNHFFEQMIRILREN